jgi:hypothetical protein
MYIVATYLDGLITIQIIEFTIILSLYDMDR